MLLYFLNRSSGGEATSKSQPVCTELLDLEKRQCEIGTKGARTCQLHTDV